MNLKCLIAKLEKKRNAMQKQTVSACIEDVAYKNMSDYNFHLFNFSLRKYVKGVYNLGLLKLQGYFHKSKSENNNSSNNNNK